MGCFTQRVLYDRRQCCKTFLITVVAFSKTATSECQTQCCKTASSVIRSVLNQQPVSIAFSKTATIVSLDHLSDQVNHYLTASGHTEH